MARTGRRPSAGGAADGAAGGSSPGGTSTRDAILAAARAVFGAHGYDGASLRVIAAAAGVDPALIHHYFGSKQQLFVAASHMQFEPADVRSMIFAGDRETTGERIVRFFLGLWEDPLRRPIMLGMIRSATTDPEAAAMVKSMIIEGGIMPLVMQAGVTDARLRVTLVASHLMGLAMVRYILCVEPLASAPVETIVAAVAPTIQRYVTGPLEGAASQSTK